MKIFITGATGFIGKHLVNQLIKEGRHVTINLYRNESAPFSSNVKTYKMRDANIYSDINFLKQESFDGIIHLASLYLTNHRPEDVIQLTNSNVSFGSYILECSSQAGIKWFINTGTFWQNFQNFEYSPVNLYAATKQAFEIIAQFYIEKNQIKFTTIRLCDTYGQNDTRLKIFNIWEKIAETGEAIDMSPGDQLIDISYIDDVVNAYTLLANLLNEMNNKITNGAIYAVKAKQRYSLKELAVIFEKVTGKKLTIRWGGRPYRDREVMIPWEKGEVVPGWVPRISIEEGIRRLYFKL